MMALFNNTETSSNIRLQYQMCSKKNATSYVYRAFLACSFAASKCLPHFRCTTINIAILGGT